MTRKLDKEHLEAINEIRTEFASNAQTLGAIAIDLKITEQQIKNLQEQQARYFAEFDALREKEQKLMETMRERYGSGQINIADGTFTPDSGLVE